MQSSGQELDSDAPATTRFRGNRGGIIPMHRALAQLRFGPAEMLSSVTLAGAMISAWILSLPIVSAFWKQLFTLALRFLPLQGDLRTELHDFAIGFAVPLPYFEFDPIMPSTGVWAGTCIAVLGTFALTFRLPSKLIPVTYLLRCVLFVQASALVYFAIFPAQFLYTPGDYLDGLLMSGAALIAIVPILFLFTYYIFPFSFLKKSMLTLVTMAYIAIFLPFQVMLHALLLQKSILFMPVLYLVLGMPLDVLIIVALYAWGMTWQFRKSQMGVGQFR